MEVKRLLSKMILIMKRGNALTPLESELISDYFSKLIDEDINTDEIQYRVTHQITGKAFGFDSEYAKENKKVLRYIGEAIHYLNEDEVIRIIKTPII